MNISNAEHRFHTSAIVGGIIPIALGTAFALKRKESPRTVWCFIGDMAYLSGICYEAYRYASVNNLPLRFVVEDNGYSTNTPTLTSWGLEEVSSIFPYQKLESVNMLNDRCWYYRYERKYPHVGIGKYVSMT
jgi:TPP-dependent pyruvate/acetoin dehydrogenase alpha subunit